MLHVHSALILPDGRIIFNQLHLKSPTTEDEIVKIVTDAYTNNRKIRVLAAGHSWSKIAQTQDILISLHEYRGLVSVDMPNLEATVKAGTKLSEMSHLLDERGLAMVNLGSVAGQSIAGAISTGGDKKVVVLLMLYVQMHNVSALLYIYSMAFSM